MDRTRTLTALVVLLVVLAGCSGGGAGGGDAGQADPELAGDGASDAERAATAAPEQDADKSEDTVAAAQADRAIVRTGRISLTVDSFTTVRTRVGTLARDTGGYVASASRETRGEGNRTWTVGVVTIRVPSEQFSETYDEVQTLGEVREASSDTTDVTDQLVDIEARLETLRAERARLRSLYADANDTETVLRVSQELSDVQTEIERLEAQKRNLENRVAFSTITVEIREERPERPTPTPRPGYADTPIGEAFFASVNGVVTAVKAVGVTIAYALPYLLVFGIPLGGLGVVIARRR